MIGFVFTFVGAALLIGFVLILFRVVREAKK